MFNDGIIPSADLKILEPHKEKIAQTNQDNLWDRMEEIIKLRPELRELLNLAENAVIDFIVCLIEIDKISKQKVASIDESIINQCDEKIDQLIIKQADLHQALINKITALLLTSKKNGLDIDWAQKLFIKDIEQVLTDYDNNTLECQVKDTNRSAFRELALAAISKILSNNINYD